MAMTLTPVNIDERKKLEFNSGDTVRVHQKVIEKGKTRIQMFEGLVIAVKHGTEAGGTFTVRAQMSGIGVEKIFPLYSPVIDKIEIVKRSKVRRAKLYFIREKVAREVRRQLRNMRMVKISTDDFKEPETIIEEAFPEEEPAIEATAPETPAEVEAVEEAEAEAPAEAEVTEELPALRAQARQTGKKEETV